MTATLRKAYLQLHASVFLWGFTAILGRLISTSALNLVWWRMLFTTISFLILMKGWKPIMQIPKKDILRLMGIGVIVAMHWITFYGAIKLANASVALVALATMTLFSAIIDPLVNRLRFNWLEIGIGIVIIPAMLLIVNQLDTSLRLGLGIGIFSAACSSTFTIFNKQMITKVTPLSMSFIELGSGWLFLTLFMPFFVWNTDVAFIPSQMDFALIIVLTLLCTTLPYIMSLHALQHVSPFVISLSLNLEPVYGIIMAILILHEDRELSLGFYSGVMVLLATVIGYPLLKNIKK